MARNYMYNVHAIILESPITQSIYILIRLVTAAPTLALLPVIDDCVCEAPCEDTVYDTQVYQAPWPHVSHQISFYDSYIFHKVSDWQRFAAVYEKIYENGSYSDLYNVDLIARNFLQINVHMKHGINMVSDTVKITPVSLVGNLGGILNLWIGFTFVTVVEICDLVYQLVMTKTKWRRRQEGESSNVTSQGDEVSKNVASVKF